MEIETVTETFPNEKTNNDDDDLAPLDENDTNASPSSGKKPNRSSSTSFPNEQPVNVLNLTETEQCLFFTLENVDVSIANAIRRTILSNIETVVFRTTPHDKNDCVIYVNTTSNPRLSNELIKQRLSCIPIHLRNVSAEQLAHMRLEVNVENTMAEYRMVTTKDFKVKYKGQYLSEEERDKIFPHSKVVAQKLGGKKAYIDFVKLRPRIENMPGSHLHLECGFSFGKASQDGSFNVVSTCSYGFTKDESAVEEAYHKKSEELTQKGLSEEEVRFALKDWLLLDSFRITKPNSFDFVIESVGVYSNREIVARGCLYLIELFLRIDQICKVTYVGPRHTPAKKDPIPPPSTSTASATSPTEDTPPTPRTEISETLLDYEYVIYVNEEDYTIGKVMERFLYQKYFEETGEMTFCGFRKAHPHDTYATIRVCYQSPTQEEEVVMHLKNVAKQARMILGEIVREMVPDMTPPATWL
jgi:DNA-directed RNA polymerase subunit L